MGSRSSHEIAAFPGAEDGNPARRLRIAALPAPGPLEGLLESGGETQELRFEVGSLQLGEARFEQTDAAPMLSEPGLVKSRGDLDEPLERRPALAPFPVPDLLPGFVRLEVASPVEERPSALEQLVPRVQRRAPARRASRWRA